MLLYLTSNENLGLFDFLTDENGMLVKKLSGEFLLKRFVVHDMRNLNHFSYVVIDLESLKDNENDIVEALGAFKAMYDARIILLAEKANKILLDRIIDETEIYNIITAKTIEKIEEEIRMSISPQGISKDYIVKSMNTDLDIAIENTPKYSIIGKNTKIIIAGSMSRVGTTTTAINMSSYLANIGAKVSYTEANTNNHLMAIHSYFLPNNSIKENSFIYKGIDFFLNGNLPVDDYDFNIVDIGALKEGNSQVLQIGDIKILCSGNKPYELEELKKSINLIDFSDKNLYIMIPESEILDIKKKLSVDFDKICVTKFSPNLFDGNINNNIWELILNEYIVRHKTLTPFSYS